mmetsp:Transcript_67382/g.186485  ORF Transcript_67382/g.186485 Transcript_67382/m.186485 type:complete len:205 (-) Transcript_67382:353-967(-)
MGASGSLLMQTMVLLSFMPARCWMAPLMPTATYRLGATTLPVWPTCMSLGTKPASTAAREAPTAAPSLSASLYSISKFSPFFMPRPPAITTEAEDSSGRSLLVFSSRTNEDRPASGEAAAGASSTAALPPSAAAASKAVPRTVIILTASEEVTVAMALPAYMGRSKVSSPSTAVISERGATSSLAATRGMKSLAKLVLPAKMCE